MKNFLLSAAAVIALASPSYAQDVTSTSGSNADANSGSVSGAAANGNQQGQTQSNVGGNNAGIGNSRSASDSNATSASESHSGSISDQHQGQSNDSRTTTSTAQTQGQQATNQQGVSVSNTFNSTQLKRTYVGTNTAVPLAASSSFSSDYCGGTVSGGASVAPIGVSIGASAPKFDDSCKYLRVAEKAGMMGANWHNMGQEEMAYKLQAYGTWAVCMAGPRAKRQAENAAMQACLALGLMGTGAVPATPPQYVPPAPPSPAPQSYVTPMETQKPNTTQGTDDYMKPKTPRGAADPSVTPDARPVATTAGM